MDALFSNIAIENSETILKDTDHYNFLEGLFDGTRKAASLDKKAAEATYKRSVANYLNSIAIGNKRPPAPEQKDSNIWIIVGITLLAVAGVIGVVVYKNRK